MAEYIYICPECGNELDVIERMMADEVHICDICGAQLHRKPQVVAVNWNGLPPSRGEIHPNIRRMIDGAPERRDKEVKHESNHLARAKSGR